MNRCILWPLGGHVKLQWPTKDKDCHESKIKTSISENLFAEIIIIIRNEELEYMEWVLQPKSSGIAVYSSSFGITRNTRLKFSYLLMRITPCWKIWHLTPIWIINYCDVTFFSLFFYICPFDIHSTFYEISTSVRTVPVLFWYMVRVPLEWGNYRRFGSNWEILHLYNDFNQKYYNINWLF